MFTSKEFRRIAREKLKGNWGKCVLVSFIAALLGGVGGGGGGSAGGAAGGNAGSEIAQGAQSTGELIPDLVASVNAELGTSITVEGMTAVFAILGILFLILCVIGPAVELGHNRYYTNLILNNEAGPVGRLFDRFDIFFKAFGLKFFMGLKIFLWSLLFVVPGIIASYRYALAPFIMAENPGMGIREAVNESKRLMEGNKWRLFCLGFSFIGWALLTALTLGIAGLWVLPYMSAATAAFYVERTGRQIPLAAQGE